MQVPNGEVRYNACQLLLALFPVREDDLPVEERQELFQMQYNCFMVCILPLCT